MALNLPLMLILFILLTVGKVRSIPTPGARDSTAPHTPPRLNGTNELQSEASHKISSVHQNGDNQIVKQSDALNDYPSNNHTKFASLSSKASRIHIEEEMPQIASVWRPIRLSTFKSSHNSSIKLSNNVTSGHPNLGKFLNSLKAQVTSTTIKPQLSVQIVDNNPFHITNPMAIPVKKNSIQSHASEISRQFTIYDQPEHPSNHQQNEDTGMLLFDLATINPYNSQFSSTSPSSLPSFVNLNRSLMSMTDVSSEFDKWTTTRPTMLISTLQPVVYYASTTESDRSANSGSYESLPSTAFDSSEISDVTLDAAALFEQQIEQQIEQLRRLKNHFRHQPNSTPDYWPSLIISDNSTSTAQPKVTYDYGDSVPEIITGSPPPLLNGAYDEEMSSSSKKFHPSPQLKFMPNEAITNNSLKKEPVAHWQFQSYNQQDLSLQPLKPSITYSQPFEFDDVDHDNIPLLVEPPFIDQTIQPTQLPSLQDLGLSTRSYGSVRSKDSTAFGLGKNLNSTLKKPNRFRSSSVFDNGELDTSKTAYNSPASIPSSYPANVINAFPNYPSFPIEPSSEKIHFSDLSTSLSSNLKPHRPFITLAYGTLPNTEYPLISNSSFYPQFKLKSSKSNRESSSKLLSQNPIIESTDIKGQSSTNVKQSSIPYYRPVGTSNGYIKLLDERNKEMFFIRPDDFESLKLLHNSGLLSANQILHSTNKQAKNQQSLLLDGSTEAMRDLMRAMDAVKTAVVKVKPLKTKASKAMNEFADRMRERLKSFTGQYSPHPFTLGQLNEFNQDLYRERMRLNAMKPPKALLVVKTKSDNASPANEESKDSMNTMKGSRSFRTRLSSGIEQLASAASSAVESSFNLNDTSGWVSIFNISTNAGNSSSKASLPMTSAVTSAIKNALSNAASHISESKNRPLHLQSLSPTFSMHLLGNRRPFLTQPPLSMHRSTLFGQPARPLPNARTLGWKISNFSASANNSRIKLPQFNLRYLDPKTFTRSLVNLTSGNQTWESGENAAKHLLQVLQPAADEYRAASSLNPQTVSLNAYQVNSNRSSFIKSKTPDHTYIFNEHVFNPINKNQSIKGTENKTSFFPNSVNPNLDLYLHLLHLVNTSISNQVAFSKQSSSGQWPVLRPQTRVSMQFNSPIASPSTPLLKYVAHPTTFPVKSLPLNIGGYMLPTPTSTLRRIPPVAPVKMYRARVRPLLVQYSPVEGVQLLRQLYAILHPSQATPGLSVRPLNQTGSFALGPLMANALTKSQTLQPLNYSISQADSSLRTSLPPLLEPIRSRLFYLYRQLERQLNLRKASKKSIKEEEKTTEEPTIETITGDSAELDDNDRKLIEEVLSTNQDEDDEDNISDETEDNQYDFSRVNDGRSRRSSNETDYLSRRMWNISDQQKLDKNSIENKIQVAARRQLNALGALSKSLLFKLTLLRSPSELNDALQTSDGNIDSTRSETVPKNINFDYGQNSSSVIEKDVHKKIKKPQIMYVDDEEAYGDQAQEQQSQAVITGAPYEFGAHHNLPESLPLLPSSLPNQSSSLIDLSSFLFSNHSDAELSDLSNENPYKLQYQRSIGSNSILNDYRQQLDQHKLRLQSLKKDVYKNASDLPKALKEKTQIEFFEREHILDKQESNFDKQSHPSLKSVDSKKDNEEEKEFSAVVTNQPEDRDNESDWSDYFSDESRNKHFRQQIPTVIYDDIERSTSNQPSGKEMYSKRNVKYRSKLIQPEDSSWKQSRVYQLLDNGTLSLQMKSSINNPVLQRINLTETLGKGIREKGVRITTELEVLNKDAHQGMEQENAIYPIAQSQVRPLIYTLPSSHQPQISDYNLSPSALETLLTALKADVYKQDQLGHLKELNSAEPSNFVIRKAPQLSSFVPEPQSSKQNLKEMFLPTNTITQTPGSHIIQPNHITMEQLREIINENKRESHTGFSNKLNPEVFDSQNLSRSWLIPQLFSQTDQQPMSSSLIETFAKNQTLPTTELVNTDLLMQRFSDIMRLEIQNLLKQISSNHTNDHQFNFNMSTTNNHNRLNNLTSQNDLLAVASISNITTVSYSSLTTSSPYVSTINTSKTSLDNSFSSTTQETQHFTSFQDHPMQTPTSESIQLKHPLRKDYLKQPLPLSSSKISTGPLLTSKRNSYIPEHIYTIESVNGVRTVVQKPFANNLLNQIEFKKRFMPYQDSVKTSYPRFDIKKQVSQYRMNR